MNSIPEFKRYCRPFAPAENGPQPGFVIEFATDITSGKNVFGRELDEGDYAYFTANFATKIHSLGLWFEGYNDAALATSPRVYLVPGGNDVLRQSGAGADDFRMWNVIEQRIPTPFAINDENLNDLGFIPSTDSFSGEFAELRRFGDVRAHHITEGTDAVDEGQLTTSSRLVGRSVWNTRWLLFIPGATLHADPEFGLEEFANKVSDIKLQFETYSHEGR